MQRLFCALILCITAVLASESLNGPNSNVVGTKQGRPLMGGKQANFFGGRKPSWIERMRNGTRPQLPNLPGMNVSWPHLPNWNATRPQLPSWNLTFPSINGKKGGIMGKNPVSGKNVFGMMRNGTRPQLPNLPGMNISWPHLPNWNATRPQLPPWNLTFPSINGKKGGVMGRNPVSGGNVFGMMRNGTRPQLPNLPGMNVSWPHLPNWNATRPQLSSWNLSLPTQGRWSWNKGQGGKLSKLSSPGKIGSQQAGWKPTGVAGWILGKQKSSRG